MHTSCSSTSVKTILDHVITDILQFQYKVILNDIDISDHRSIITSIKLNTLKANNSCTKLYKYIDFKKIKDKIAYLIQCNDLPLNDFRSQLSKSFAENTKTLVKRISRKSLIKSCFNDEHDKIK
jgi:hypothetical protein